MFRIKKKIIIISSVVLIFFISFIGVIFASQGIQTNEEPVKSPPSYQPHYPSESTAFTQTIAEGESVCKSDVVFVIDTTASMTPYINNIKATIHDILINFSSSEKDFSVGGVEFGDEIRNWTDLTKDFTSFESWINDLEAFGGGDFDTPENQLDALWNGTELANFRADAKKIFILFTDAPYHTPGDGGDANVIHSYDQVKARLLGQNVTLFVFTDETVYDNLILSTHGRRFDLIEGNTELLDMIAKIVECSCYNKCSCYSNNGAGVCTVNTGERCACVNQALNDQINCSKEVRLQSDINNVIGTCVANPANFNNKILDCQGHTIDGNDDDWYLPTPYGIYLVGKSRNTIRDCVVTDFFHGIYLSSSSNNIITNNTEKSNSHSGIELQYSSNNTLTSNTAISNSVGIGVAFYSSNNTVTNNTANSNGYGLEIHFSSNNTVTNNTANSNSYGIWSYVSSNNIITSNTANLNQQNGIYLRDSSSNTIQTNHISNNNVGIYSQNSNSTINVNYVCENIVLDLNSLDWRSSSGDNNMCNKPDGWNDLSHPGCKYSCSSCYINNGGGICTVNTGENCTCVNQALNDTGCYNEVRLQSDINNWVGTCVNNPANFNNKILDCQGHTIDGDDSGYSERDYGIYLNGKSGNTIRRCVITDFYYGIYLEYSSNNIITNNTEKSNSWNGIYLEYSSGNTLTNNIANSNNGNGIVLDSSLTNNITSNIANSNSHSGIVISFSSNNNITSNTAKLNNYGIDLYSSSNNTVQKNHILNNSFGIYSRDSNSTINSNHICHNIVLDLNSPDWLSSSGDNNICDNPDGWNDLSNSGCKYTCRGDTIPLFITILSPTNTTYYTTSVPLNFIINNPTSWIGYSLDNKPNITISGNIALTGLSYSSHKVIVYANDIYGNMGASDKVYFTVKHSGGGGCGWGCSMT